MAEADAVGQVFSGSGFDGRLEVHDHPTSEYWQVWYTLKEMLHRQRVVLLVCEVRADRETPGATGHILAAEVCLLKTGYTVQDFGFAPLGSGVELAEKLVAWAKQQFGKGVLYKEALDVFSCSGLVGTPGGHENELTSEATFVLPRIMINDRDENDHMVLSVFHSLKDKTLVASACLEGSGETLFEGETMESSPENATRAAQTLVEWVKQQGCHAEV